MKTMVTAVLAKPEVTKISFSYGGVKVDSNGFKRVISSINSNKIKVQHNARLGSKKGIYRYTHNTLFLGFKATGGDADREALIVHECVHAISDIAGTKMLVSKSEAVAYIAQCLYFYYKNETAIKSGQKPTFKVKVLQKAWDAAMKAVQNGSLTNADVKPLLDEIAKHPTYRSRHSKDVLYDGV